MALFKDNKTLHKFASVYASTHNVFNFDQYLFGRNDFKKNHSAALAEWYALVA